MRANYHKLNNPIEQAFYIREDIRDYFDDHWHYHNMLELVYIKKGDGIRYMGDSIDAFTDGDVVLLGAELPHVWKSSIMEKEKLVPKSSKAIVIQFSLDFLGNHFMSLSETQHIKALTTIAKRGIVFKNADRKIIAKKTEALLKYEGMERLIKFIDLLHYAALAKDYILLASPVFVDTLINSDEKINKVFSYVLDNFTEDLELSTVSSVINMNKSAFCRYFKNRTKKTFTMFLNEVRIGHACKLISQDKIPITECAYLSGYNSPSYFYKQFKQIKGISPSEYQSKTIQTVN
ncbi:AraC family transcriptional regulator [Arenibacter certesii]|uniref:AraC family transcriptional regulator n=1 Tax=Arenibacter certesii TaxID=228955 RepID=A0A918J651_9FLAO|nr:AraC family transcriptional regulator [Arenibacter certesii]GGW49510.1 AraC family transcriptional regulator [Arenibacter certesii]